MKNKNANRISAILLCVLVVCMIIASTDYSITTFLWLSLATEIIGWITAYPKNKRCVMEEYASGRVWTIGDALEAIAICSIFWWIVWIDYLGKNYEELFPFFVSIKKILYKKSPL